jgi:DNA-binding transcriptional ArsR family regulator
MIQTANVDAAAAAAVFENPRQRRIVLALVEQECSLSQLARLTGTPLSLLHHHMARLLRLGLVEITRRQTRAGAAIKFYRAAARSFFVPAELAGADLGRRGARLRAALDRSLASTWKGVVYSQEGGWARMSVVRDPDSSATAFELWLELPLTRADAQDLQQALRAVLERFKGRQAAGAGRYIVHAALALAPAHGPARQSAQRRSAVTRSPSSQRSGSSRSS